MKLSNWVAVIGCVGLGIGAAVGAQGCTASLVVGSCDGGCFSEDSGAPANQDSGTPATEDSGASVNDSSTTTPDGGDATTSADPCNTCLYGQCVSQYANCVADQTPVTGCLAIYQCATSAACAADGGSCVQDCYNMGSATGKALYLTLGDCDQTAQCSAPATPGGACGTICTSTAASCPAPAADDAGEDAAVVDAGSCSACQAASCGTELTACGSGTACATYNQCLLACTTSACDTACATNDDAGASAAAALGACTATNCSVPCQ